MSNGVGVLRSISASLPPIAASVAPDADEGVRPAGRGSEAGPRRRTALRGPSAPPAPRIEADPAPARGIRLKPAPAGAVLGATAAHPALKPAGLTPDALRRIADAGQVAQARGASRIRLTLRPAHLGSLSIDLSLRGSVLRGIIRTETSAARELILRQLDRLRESLESRGIRVGDLQVQVESQARRPAGDGRARGRGGNPEAAAEDAPLSGRRRGLDILA
jgi:hypothetical protein